MKLFKLFILLIGILFITACTTKISDIKNDKYIGEEVTVKGTVEDSLKIGDLSGFTLRDDSGSSIKVASESLPAEGDTITITGIVLDDSIFGYYIQRK